MVIDFNRPNNAPAANGRTGNVQSLEPAGKADRSTPAEAAAGKQDAPAAPANPCSSALKPSS